MKREDLQIDKGTITIHPDKLSAMKKEALADITPDAIGRIRDTVIDEELEMFVEELVYSEVADRMRAEVILIRIQRNLLIQSKPVKDAMGAVSSQGSLMRFFEVTTY
jgi:hypothetical protein